VNTLSTMALTILLAGDIQDRQAGYLRRAFRSLMSRITASDLARDVAAASVGVIIMIPLRRKRTAAQ
jgi:hypothetical protein